MKLLLTVLALSSLAGCVVAVREQRPPPPPGYCPGWVWVPGHHGPRGALFARVTPKAPLEALHEKLDRLLVRLGHEPERRAFQPHITLARRRSGAGPPHEWLARMSGLHAAPEKVETLTLFESRLGRHGASYESLIDGKLSA